MMTLTGLAMPLSSPVIFVIPPWLRRAGGRRTASNTELQECL